MPSLKRVLVRLVKSRRSVEIKQQQGFAIATLLVCGTLLGVGALQPVFVHADTIVIPVAKVAERYDSNVYRRTPSILPPGTKVDDFVSSVGGGVQILHKSREVEANIDAGGEFNTFVYNPGLNFFSTRLRGTAILDGWVDQWARGAKLRVKERFLYTPDAPSFSTRRQDEDTDDPFLGGIQGFRADTFRNTTVAEGSYRLGQILSLQGSLGYATQRIGRIQTQTPDTSTVFFFDTNVYTGSIGPQFRLTPTDSIAFTYRQSLITQTRTTGSTGTIETGTLTLSTDYARVMQDWTFSVVGGATYIEPVGETFPTGTVALSTTPERETTVQLDFSRLIRPSYFIVGGVIISNVGRVQISQRLSERLSLQGSAYYAFNQTISSQAQGNKFNNLTLSTGLSYNLTRTMIVDLSYIHTDFKRELAVTDNIVLRDMVTLSLTAQWD
jgi:hypothetical protein